MPDLTIVAPAEVTITVADVAGTTTYRIHVAAAPVAQPPVTPPEAERCVIDLSHWNTVTAWPEVAKAGVVGVIHKVTQGGGYRDPAYEARRPAAKAAGLLWGRYHFGDATPVQAQVDNFLDGWQPDEAIALDWEFAEGSTMTVGQAMAFVSEVEKRTGVVPMLYSGNVLKEAAANGAFLGILLKCPLWLAEWGAEANLPKGYTTYRLWQYSSTGSIPGIAWPVDLNRFNNEVLLRATWAPQPRPAMIA